MKALNQVPRPAGRSMYPSRNKQRNLFVFNGIVVVFLFFAAGCATNAGRYDQAGLAENDCTIVLRGSLLGEPIIRITSFNGEPVDWKGDFGIIIGALPGKDFRVQIPAGEHTLTGLLQSVSTDNDSPYIDNGHELTVTFTFIVGHIYEADISSDSVLRFIRSGV